MKIPYGRQDINHDDIKSVVEVLESDWLTQGPSVEKFEDNIALKCNSKAGAVAVNSATSALHIACIALGLKQDDWLWTSPNTFVASANCAIYCGANVDFVDIHPETYNMCTESLKRKLVEAKKLGRLPKIVMPVHFGGSSCNMEEIHNLSKKYNFKIIEDASHAIGGTYKDFPIGSCKYSDITVFSFHPVKIITTAEGGILLTNDNEVKKKLVTLRSHGITKDSNDFIGKNDGPWFYQQHELGFNYRMTDIQAALGSSQLTRLESFLNIRNEIAECYKRKLSSLPISYQQVPETNYSAYHLFVINLDEDLLSRKEEIFSGLLKAGVGANVHYIPVHLHPYYKEKGFKEGDFPVAELYYKRAISLPLHSTLTSVEQDYVIDNLKNSLKI